MSQCQSSDFDDFTVATQEKVGFYFCPLRKIHTEAFRGKGPSCLQLSLKRFRGGERASVVDLWGSWGQGK